MQAVNQLKSLLVTADPAVRQPLTGLSTNALIGRCAGLPDQISAQDAAIVFALRSLARRIST